MSAQMTSELVAGALMMAIWRRGWPQELLHHSDQGSQYSSESFQRLLAEHGITCSMSRQGDVWDNSAMERFFSTLKTERVNRKVFYGYGYGFEVYLTPGGRVIGHGGSAPGASARLEMNTQTGYIVVVLSNYGSAAPPIAKRLSDLLAQAVR